MLISKKSIFRFEKTVWDRRFVLILNIIHHFVIDVLSYSARGCSFHILTKNQVNMAMFIFHLVFRHTWIPNEILTSRLLFLLAGALFLSPSSSLFITYCAVSAKVKQGLIYAHSYPAPVTLEIYNRERETERDCSQWVGQSWSIVSDRGTDSRTEWCRESRCEGQINPQTDRSVGKTCLTD